ncbi:MAG: DedA family protein [Clostridiales bacterium]|nr:DedA family protein [Clostridiales bacterium]
MQDLIIQIMNQFGYIGVLLMVAIENIFPPIPSEIILTFGGFMTTYTTMNIPGVILFSTAGSVLGAIILYGAGRWLSPEKLERWLDGRIGRLLHFKKEDISKAARWFSGKGKIAVLACRCIPVVRSLISIPAGIARMNMVSFLVLTTIGTAVWNTVLVCLGAAAGASWESIVGYMDTYSNLAMILLAVLLVVLVGVFYKKRLSGKTVKEG